MPDRPVKKNYFELFQRIAKDEFGVEIQRRTDGKKQTFEEIFGVDLDSVFIGEHEEKETEEQDDA